MARGNLPLTQWSRAGIVPDGPEVDGDPVNNHQVANDGHVVVHVRNAGATPRDLTVRLAKQVDGRDPAPRVHTLGNAAAGWIGPWPPGDYGSLVAIDVPHADVKMTAYHL